MPGRPPRKYPIDEAGLEKIRAVWSAALSRRDFREAITRLTVELNMPRHAVRYNATMLGLNFERVAWSDYEEAYIRASAGLVPIREMARHLHRSVPAVAKRAKLRRLSVRCAQGYSREMLVRLLRVAKTTVDAWKAKGWLRMDPDGRYSHGAVERFLRNHLCEIDLRLVDQVWMHETLTNMLQAVPEPDTRSGYDYAVSPGNATGTRRREERMAA